MVTRRIDILDHTDFPHAEVVGESIDHDAGFSDEGLANTTHEIDTISFYDYAQILTMAGYEGAFDDTASELPRLMSQQEELSFAEIKTSLDTEIEDVGNEELARRGVSLKLHDGSGE